MSVRAKFYVSAVKRTEGSSTADQVTLGAVCRGVENALWAQYTPAGQIQLGVLNEAATAQFVVGEEYEVTFTRVAKPTPGDGHTARPVRTTHEVWICETCGGSPSWDRSRFDWKTVPLAELDWSTHDEVYSSKG